MPNCLEQLSPSVPLSQHGAGFPGTVPPLHTALPSSWAPAALAHCPPRLLTRWAPSAAEAWARGWPCGIKATRGAAKPRAEMGGHCGWAAQREGGGSALLRGGFRQRHALRQGHPEMARRETTPAERPAVARGRRPAQSRGCASSVTRPASQRCHGKPDLASLPMAEGHVGTSRTLSRKQENAHMSPGLRP